MEVLFYEMLCSGTFFIFSRIRNVCFSKNMGGVKENKFKFELTRSSKGHYKKKSSFQSRKRTEIFVLKSLGTSG